MSLSNTSPQALENFRREVQNENREIELKSAELKKKEDEIARKKLELQKMESDAANVKLHLEELKHRRMTNEQEITRIQQELQKLIKEKK